MADRTLVVGDVHGCARELALLLDRAAADRVVLLGDLFSKGPDPVGVWRLIRTHDLDSVMGNHDLAILERPGRSPLPQAALDWLARRPSFITQGRTWLAVHAGLDPDRGAAGTSRHQAAHLRRWPDEDDPDNPFWWQLWHGPPLVIYGHDAVRGLVDRRPHSLGLDTGCVYGGALTGFLVEEGRFLHQPAARVYRDVGREPWLGPLES